MKISLSLSSHNSDCHELDESTLEDGKTQPTYASGNGANRGSS